MAAKKIIRGLFLLSGMGVSVFSSMACKEESGDVLARIGQRDSVTVNEFKWELEKAYGNRSTALSFQDKKNFLIELTEAHLKTVAALDDGLDQDSDHREEVRRAKDNLILTEARDRYIYNKYINAETIANYKIFRHTTAKVKILVVAFNKGSKDNVTRSKAQARNTIDSVYAAITVTNFDHIAETMSDYKNRQTGRGNLIPFAFKYGAYPIDFAYAVFSASPNSVTRPVELAGSYIIAYVVSFESDQNPTDQDLGHEEIRQSMKNILTDFEVKSINTYETKFKDSLYSLANVHFDQANVDTFVRKFRTKVNGDGSRRDLRDGTPELSLATYQGNNKVTIEDILNYFKMYSALPALTKSLITQSIIDYVKNELLKQLVVQAGYTESSQFKYSLLEARRRDLIGKIESRKVAASKDPSLDELQTAYHDNLSQYQTAATTDVKEIYSLYEKSIERCSELIRSGTDLDKAVERLRSELNDPSLTFKNTVSYSEKNPNEITKAASYLKVGDISGIIPRKSGGYSIIQAVGKKESVLQLFEVVRGQVLVDYLAKRKQQATTVWLSELTRKYPVIIFENNVNQP
jgi:hypothetical protein